MKVLVTGFKPFLGEAINPSEKLAIELSRIFPFVESLILPVEFKKSFEILSQKVSSAKPDFIIMIGQAAGRANVCLEKVGLNWVQSDNADEAGVKPKPGKILPDHELALMTRFPVDQVFLELRKAQLPVEISFSAGAYVCNDIYFRVLNEIKNIPAVFIHVPLLPEQLKKQDVRSALSFDLQLETLSGVISFLKQS